MASIPIRAAVLAGAAVLPAIAQAQDRSSEFAIEGSVRVRGEAIDGQYRPNGPEHDALIAVQTIVKAEYDAGPVRFGAELIDARTYGQAANSSVGTSDNNALELTQAWVSFDLGSSPAAGAWASVQLGRFTMDLGSGRLIGRAGFPGSPNNYVGARFDWAGQGGNALTAFWTMPIDRLPTGTAATEDHHVEIDRATTDRQLYGAIFTRTIGSKAGAIEAYGYRLAERDAPGYPTRNRRLNTVGARLVRQPAEGRLDYEFEGAWQSGSVRGSASAADVTDLDVSAGMAHASAGWTFAGGWKPRIAATFDYASGDGADPATYGQFDPLFLKRSGDFGPTTLYGPLTYSNLVMLGAAISANPKGWDLFVKPRFSWLASATAPFAATGIRDAAGNSGQYGGMQLEAYARTWLLPKRLQFELGGAWLAKGRFLTSAPNVRYTDDTLYGYAALTAKF